MNHALILALRARGVDVISALDAGMLERSDEEHLEFAAAERRALYTYNIADFSRLHNAWLSAGRSHAGLILVQQQQYSIGEQLRRLLKLNAARSSEEMVDRAAALRLPEVPAPDRLGGPGSLVRPVSIETTIQLTSKGGGQVAFRSQFVAVTALEALDMSVLGRDITGLFAVIVDRPGDLVCLVGQRHRYSIVAG